MRLSRNNSATGAGQPMASNGKLKTHVPFNGKLCDVVSAVRSTKGTRPSLIHWPPGNEQLGGDSPVTRAKIKYAPRHAAQTVPESRDHEFAATNSRTNFSSAPFITMAHKPPPHSTAISGSGQGAAGSLN